MIEIFQTIWVALNTENDVLTKILGIPSVFIEAYVSMLIFTTVLDINTNHKQKLIYVFTIGIFGIISAFFIPIPYNTYLTVIVFLLCNLFILKSSIFKCILSLVIPFITAIIAESIFSKLYFFLFNISYDIGVNIPIHRFLGTLLVYSIMFLIYLFLKYSKINISKLEIIDFKKKFLLILNIIFGIVLIATQLYILIFYAATLPFFVILISLFCLIAYFIISLYTINTVFKLEKTSMNLEESQLYNKTLEILQDNTRAFRHDFSNILQGMVGYIDNNDMEGLKKYYSQLIEDIQESNNLTTLSPKVVNNPAIYNVLANKYHKADSLGIKIHLEAFLDMNELYMKIYEFTRILGILMDNAIEATCECENKIINVTFRKDSRKHMQLLIIENTYKNKDIDTEKIFEKGYSTKKENTGLGLWEIRQILKKNNNLNLFTSKNSDFFIQQFEIYY